MDNFKERWGWLLGMLLYALWLVFLGLIVRAFTGNRDY
jgi:hypothetical protein